MTLMFIAGILFFIRIHRWPQFKRENDYTDADVRKHQHKLLIYAIMFAIGFVWLMIELILGKYFQ